MSERTCPHCQAVIPANTEGRCPSCGQLLVTSPLHLDVSVQRKRASRVGRALFIAALVGGAVLAIEAVLRFGRGVDRSAFYDCLGLLVALLFFTRNEYLRSVPTESPRQGLRLTRWVVYVAMGVGLYLGLRIWGAQSDLAAIDGTSRPGQYRNEYFGFQLSYDSPWQDVTETNRTAPAGASFGRSLLLALTLPPSPDHAIAANVVLTAIKVPDAEADLTGGEHLDLMISKLMERGDRPRHVKTERQTVLAGMTFDRLSLKRTWEGDEIGMTFWATRRRSYLILITGSYSTDQGLVAIEELLTNMVTTDRN